MADAADTKVIVAPIGLGQYELRELVVARVYGTTDTDALLDMTLPAFPSCVVARLRAHRRAGVKLDALPPVDHTSNRVALRIGPRRGDLSLDVAPDDIAKAIDTFVALGKNA